MNEVIETRIYKIWLGENGVIRVSTLPNAEGTLADAEENIAAIRKLSKGKRRRILIDNREIKSQDREAREYYAEQGKHFSSVAILVGSPVSRSLVNFFMKINKPVAPTKLFSSEAQAIEWLKGFVE